MFRTLRCMAGSSLMALPGEARGAGLTLGARLPHPLTRTSLGTFVSTLLFQQWHLLTVQPQSLGLTKEQNVLVPRSSSQVTKSPIVVKTESSNGGQRPSAAQSDVASWQLTWCPFVSFLWERMRPASLVNFRGRAEERLCICAYVRVCVCSPLGHQT